MRVEDEVAQEWYANEAVTQNWSSRALERQVSRLYYERLLSSKVFATRYKLVLPSEEQLRLELIREQRLLAEQAEREGQ